MNQQNEKNASVASDLTFEEVETHYRNTGHTETEASEKATEYMNRIFKDNWTKPQEILPEDIENAAFYIEDIDDPEEAAKVLSEDNDIPLSVARKLVHKVQETRTEDYQYKEKLSKQDVQCCDKLRAAHGSKWSYRHYCEVMKVK